MGAAAAWMFARPHLIGVLVVALVPALAGIRRGFPFPGVKLSELLIVLGAGAVLLLSPPTPATRWRAVDRALALYAVVAVVMAAVHVWLEGVGTSLDPVRRASAPLQFFLLYRVAVTWAVGRPDGVRSLLRAILVASVPVSLLALTQQAGVLGARDLVHSIVGAELHGAALGDGVIRATGPFPIWHSLGGYLLPVILLGVALLLEREQHVLRHRTLVAVTTLNVLACVTTLTMAVGIGLVGGCLLLGSWRRRLYRVASVMVAGTVVVVLVFGSALSFRYAQQYGDLAGSSHSLTSAQTFEYRVGVWERDFAPLVRPSLGIGIGNDLPPGVVFRHTETFYLTLLLRGGLVLVVAYAIWVATSYRSARAASLGSRGETRAVANAVAATLIVLLPMQIVWPYLANAGMPQVLFALLGVMVGASTLQRRAAGHAVRGRVDELAMSSPERVP